MRIAYILIGLVLAQLVHGTEPSNEERCREWAEIDSIPQEELSVYLQECLYSLGFPDEEAHQEEEIPSVELSEDN